MNSSIRFCDNCGETNRFDAKFCYACGQPQLTYANTATGLLNVSHQLKQRYRILDKLGQGGFGAVYQVEDTLFNNAIRAAKEMGMRGLSTQETQEAIVSFKNEALLLANLTHPNLPRIHDHFEEHGRWYLVMDYVNGETLEKRLQKAPHGRLPIEEVIQIGLQICTVLRYLHSHQPPIIFRDLKPDNVMITNAGHLYLIDFGIARFFKPGQARDTVNLGTPGYASPEQYGRMQTTVRSDLYSLGATLYHLVSGINPGLNPFLFQPLALNTKVPGNVALEALIMQMLEMKEEQRPKDTSVVEKELQSIQQMRLVVPVKLMVTPPVIPVMPSLEPQHHIIVAQDGSAQYTTISEAIQNAYPNTLILVQKGVYKESLIVDRDVEIVSSGPKGQVILECSDNHCILMHTDRATIRDFTIRCLAGYRSNQYHALDIGEGQLLVEGCDITSDSAACIAIYNAATQPIIRYCTIHSSPSNGIVIYDAAQGTIEYSDIVGNGQSEISIATGGNPLFRHCTIHNSQHHGIFAHNNAQGTFEDCDIHDNKYASAVITVQSNLLFLRCQFHHNQHYGIDIHQEGKGSFQDCDIYENGYDNVVIATESTPYFYRCKIRDGKQSGIVIKDRGRGSIEYCDISANAAANIRIVSAGNPLIQYSKIRASQQSGLSVSDGGRGIIEHCTFTENASGDLDIAPGSDVIVK